MPYMKWGAKRPRSKPIYNRRASHKAQERIVGMHMRYLNELKAASLLHGYPTRKKERSVQKYINAPGAFYPKKLYRTGYKVKTYSRMRWKRRLARPWR